MKKKRILAIVGIVGVFVKRKRVGKQKNNFRKKYQSNKTHTLIIHNLSP